MKLERTSNEREEIRNIERAGVVVINYLYKSRIQWIRLCSTLIIMSHAYRQLTQNPQALHMEKSQHPRVMIYQHFSPGTPNDRYGESVSECNSGTQTVTNGNGIYIPRYSGGSLTNHLYAYSSLGDENYDYRTDFSMGLGKTIYTGVDTFRCNSTPLPTAFS